MSQHSTPYDDLEKLFHEPRRLGIVSALLGVPTGKTFVELKAELGLTDGNLSRHLSLLQSEEVVVLRKEFVDARPQTTAVLTEGGTKKFLRYLNTLEEVLRRAQSALDGAASPSAGEGGLPEPDATI